MGPWTHAGWGKQQPLPKFRIQGQKRDSKALQSRIRVLKGYVAMQSADEQELGAELGTGEESDGK